MDRAYAPITYLDEQGNPAGIAVDLLRLIEAKSGLKIELAAARWPVVIERALRHQIDAVVNADKKPTRQERLLYTRPYYQEPQIGRASWRAKGWKDREHRVTAGSHKKN